MANTGWRDSAPERARTAMEETRRDLQLIREDARAAGLQGIVRICDLRYERLAREEEIQFRADGALRKARAAHDARELFPGDDPEPAAIPIKQAA